MNTVSTSIVGIVEIDGKILVAKKNNSSLFPMNGWHIPGGKLHEEESEEDGLKREMKEETGIDITIVKFLGEREKQNYPNGMVKWYLCKPLSIDIKPGSDVAEVKFIPTSTAKDFCDPNAVKLWIPEVLEYLTR